VVESNDRSMKIYEGYLT